MTAVYQKLPLSVNEKAYLKEKWPLCQLTAVAEEMAVCVKKKSSKAGCWLSQSKYYDWLKKLKPRREEALCAAQAQSAVKWPSCL